jgi:hypothetical protein
MHRDFWVPMVHQLGYTLSWSGNASAMLRESGEGIDYGCRVLSRGHKSSVMEGVLCSSSRCHGECCKYTRKGVSSNILLRSYSNRFKSKGLQPQLIHCAPFLSIAPYFRILYLSYPKIRMAIIVYPKVRMTIVWYLDVETSIVFLSGWHPDIGQKYID